MIAAVQAKKMGKSVVIVCPDKHLGGLSSGGLGLDRHGQQGGHRRPGARVLSPRLEALPAARRLEVAGARRVRQPGQGTPAIDGEQRTMWIFEPHVAETGVRGLRRGIRDPGAPRRMARSRDRGSRKRAARIASITMLGGQTYRGKMFIDATYEGDLMAAAGVDYHVGREAQIVNTARSGTACRPACCITGIISAC